MKTSYNVRIVDNGDKTYSIGFVSRLKIKRGVMACGLPKATTFEWVQGSVGKMVRLLTKGTLKGK